MDNQERILSEEELLQAAEEAYRQELQDLPTIEQPEEEAPAPDAPAEKPEPATEKQEQTQEKAAEEPQFVSVSTTFTAIGIAVGLVLGAVLGFVTKSVPACLIIGIVAGLLGGLLLDFRKDKKAKNQDPSILLDEGEEETEDHE